MFVLGQLLPDPGIKSSVFALLENAQRIPRLKEDV